MEPSQLPVKSFVQLPCGGIGVDSDTYFNDASTQLATRIAVGSLAELALQVLFSISPVLVDLMTNYQDSIERISYSPLSA